MPTAESRGTDLLRVLHYLYMGFVKDRRKDFPIFVNHLHVHSIQHGKMRECADFLNKVLREIGKNPWTIIAHVDECDAPPPGFEHQGGGAHVCGFWAIRLSEQREETSAIKVPFGFMSSEPEWLWEIANLIIDLFELSGSHFKWDDPKAIAATRQAKKREQEVSV